MSKGRFAAVAAGFRDLARACVAIEAAFLDLDVEPRQREPAARAPVASPAETPARSPHKVESALRGADRKILTALAQHGVALSVAQIGTLAGLSSSTGTFNQSVARLRAQGLAEGPGSALRITRAGVDALGQFARLPEGPAIFEYWCGKVGGTGGKILRALRASARDLSSLELGEATMLAHTTGSFNQALAKLRRLKLIEGGGDGMGLSPSLAEAIAPTIGVHNTKTGETVRVKASAWKK